MKKPLFISLIMVTAMACVACNADQNTAQPAKSTQLQTTQTEATQAPTAQATPSPQKADGIWIDVRSADEYKAGHLDGAVNIAHSEIASRITELAPDKSQPINLYCRSGRRAEAALQELTKLGYTNVTNHGGYDELVKQGLK